MSGGRREAARPRTSQRRDRSPASSPSPGEAEERYVQKPTPPNASMMNAPQDAALRQEEFGDLSQAADQFDAAREYYAVALGQVRADDRATRARLLIKLA